MRSYGALKHGPCWSSLASGRALSDARDDQPDIKCLRREDLQLGDKMNPTMGITRTLELSPQFGKGHQNVWAEGTWQCLPFILNSLFIDLMGQKTRQTIMKELRDAKYFSTIVDSNRDLSHVDQLTRFL